MLFYTGVARTASDVAGSYITRLDSCWRQMHVLKELVEESIDILCSSMDLTAFGELLHEAWQAKRSLSPRVSSAEIDELYERARDAGAVGGKLTGAGGGGFLLLLVPPDRRASILKALDQQIHVPFAFDSGGSQIICNEPGVDYREVERARLARPAAAFRELASA
jgi:D-glycero-alpha-D-manno-heptose-7-phosphate kinase